MLPPTAIPADQRRLLKLFQRLGTKERRSLLDFADFLAQRERPEAARADLAVPQPKPFVRPEQETVIGAIKRLKARFFMLDSAPMLEQTASLMAAHVVQGRPAKEVIDDLEALFEEQYQRIAGDPRD